MIRHAIASDSAAIASVQNRSWRATYRGIIAQSTLDRLSDEHTTRGWVQWFAARPPDSLFLVITDPYGTATSTQVVGYAMARQAHSSGPPLARAELQVLYLAPGYPGKGLGRQLMAASAIGLEKLGYRSMQVWSLAQNPSRPFYSRLGGNVVNKRQTQVAGQVLDEVCYYWPTLSPLMAMRNRSVSH